MRPSGRSPRRVRGRSASNRASRKYAEGSCLAQFGDTHVLCTATVEERVPPLLRKAGAGWVTAEYGMLPRSTHTRTDREAARGRQSGRTQEIQRLIGRSLRAVTDLVALGERQISIDCDVLQADGGTRTAAITGSYVALHQAFGEIRRGRADAAMPLNDSVAAVSCGVVRRGAGARPRLRRGFDTPMTDANFVLTGGGGIVEIQATAEGAPFDEASFAAHARAGPRRHRRIERGSSGRRSGWLSRWRAVSPGERLVIASHNPGKVVEIDELLAPYRRRQVGAAALGLPEPEETGDDVRGKRRAEGACRGRGERAAGAGRRFRAGRGGAGRRAGHLFGALGRPGQGFRASRWSGSSASSARKRPARPFRRGPGAGLAGRRRWRCSAARSHGQLVLPPRGERGFGYDPIFVARWATTMTFGEMDPA